MHGELAGFGDSVPMSTVGVQETNDYGAGWTFLT